MTENRFKELGTAFKKTSGLEESTEEETPSPVIETENKSKKKRRQLGKRSNPDYEQIGVYIPKALHLDVKKKLLEQQDLDLSELVKKLLQEWVDS